MGNQDTKEQIRRWLKEVIGKATNPDPREKMRRMRRERAKKEQVKYGF